MQPQHDTLEVFNLSPTKKLLPGKWRIILVLGGIFVGLADMLIMMKELAYMLGKSVLVFGMDVNFSATLALVHFVFVPLAALVLSLPLSLVPIRQYRYSQKYVPVAIVVTLILQAGLLGLTLAGY